MTGLTPKPKFIDYLRNLLWRNLKHSTKIKSFLYRMIYLLPSEWRNTDSIWQELDKLSKHHSDITFVNIGSNDGLAGDPLREFIITRKWKGYLIEPVEYVFERLKKAYKGINNTTCVNIAISDSSASKDFYYIKNTDELGPGYDQLGSFDREHVLSHEYMFPNIEKHITSRQIPCLSLADFLETYKVGIVDLYLIDTEGYDYEIIQQIDFKKNSPKVVIYEHFHLSDADSNACRAIFIEHGYKVSEAGGNTIATKEHNCPST